MPTEKKDSDFTFETVACLCCALLCSGGGVTGQTYQMMSAVDGKRSANSFQHQFRAVLKRAKELKDVKDNGGVAPSVPGKPRGRGAKRAKAKKDDDDEDDDAGLSKRVKTEE